jgi:hypothetical protein
MDEIVAVWQPVRAGVIDLAHRLRRAVTHAPRRARAIAVAVVAAACSAWSLLPDVNDVLTDWSGALSGSTTGLLTGAFSGQLGSISAGEWNIATAMTGKLGMVMGVVAVALCGVQVIAAIVAGDHARLGYAALWALIAWPATATAVWLIVKVTAAIDALAIGMLSTSGSAQDIALVFTMLLANAGNQPFMLVVWAVLLWLPSLVLSLVMAFRNYSLLLLVGFAPAAVMSQGWRALRPVVTKWAQAVVALILAKVFAAGILVLAMDLVTGSPDLGALITGMVGLWMACMSPAASMAVMGWAGGQLADAGASRAGAGARRAGQAAAAPLRSAGQNATNRLVDQATHRVRESLKARATASKPVDNPAPAAGPNSNDPGQQAAGTSGQSAGGAGAKATSGAGAAAGPAGASGAAGGAGAGAGGAAAGGAAGGASAGAAAGPVGAAVGAGAGLVKSGIDKVRGAVAGAAAQGTPDASSGQDTSAGRGGAGESGDRLRSAVAAMSGANDHLLTAPGSSGPSGAGSSGMAGAPGTAGSAGSSGTAAESVVTARTAPGGPGGGRGGGGSGEQRGGAQSAAGSNQPGPDARAADTGASRPRTAPGGGSVRRPSGPGSSSGGQSGPSLFGGR